MARSPQRQQRSRQRQPDPVEEEVFDQAYDDEPDEDYEDDDEVYEDEEDEYLTLDEIDPHDGLRGFSRTPFVTLLALSLVIHAAVIVGTSVPWLMGFADAESAVEETFHVVDDAPAQEPATPADPEPRPQPPTDASDDPGEDEAEENEHIRRLQEAEPAPSDQDASREAAESLDRLSLP